MSTVIIEGIYSERVAKIRKSDKITFEISSQNAINSVKILHKRYHKGNVSVQHWYSSKLEHELKTYFVLDIKGTWKNP